MLSPNKVENMKPPEKPKKVKVCPFLQKYHIPKLEKIDTPQWMKDACLKYCPVYDEASGIGHCIFDHAGRGINKDDRERLEKAKLPCPHCKKYELHSLNEDGDWEFPCGYVMYVLPILSHRKRR